AGGVVASGRLIAGLGSAVLTGKVTGPAPGVSCGGVVGAGETVTAIGGSDVMPGGVIGPAAMGAPLTGTGRSRPAAPGGAPAAPPGCCCGPCDMTGGVIGPAALGAPLTGTGTGRTPQAPPGCCCGPCDLTGGVIGPAAIGTGWTAPPGGPP